MCSMDLQPSQTNASRSELPPQMAAESLLTAILNSTEDAIVVCDFDSTITSWNHAAERIFGYTADEAVGRPIALLLPPDRQGEEARVIARVQSGESVVRYDTVRLVKGGNRIEVSLTVTPVRNALGEVCGACKVIRDTSARRADRAALEDSEARHRAVIDTAVDGILTIDQHGTIESLNPAAERLFGAAREELIGRNISSLMPSPYQQEHDSYLDRYVRTGERRIIGIGREVVGKRKDGTTFPMDLAVSELSLGGRRMFTGIVRDISERKRAEARQRLLADELDHRVKNNLAAVLSLARQTLTTSKSLDQFKEAFTGRLRAMAETHAALARSRWENVGLDELAEVVLGPFRHEYDNRVSVGGPSVKLPARAAMPVALALHELSTNAAKYGALAAPEGRLQVSWEGNARSTTIRWIESGGRPVSAPTTSGSGTLIINGLIRHELKGSIDLRYEPMGVSCIIVVPAE